MRYLLPFSAIEKRDSWYTLLLEQYCMHGRSEKAGTEICTSSLGEEPWSDA